MGTPTSQTIFGVPISHRHCHLDNYNWPSVAVKDAVAEFMSFVGTATPKHLLLTGGPGLGKTHLAVALYRWGVIKAGTLLCAFAHVPDFFHKVKEQFSDQDAEDPFLDVQDARALLVLDDLLGRKPTPWELDHILFRLINTAYSNNAALIVTTNQTADQITQILKPHEVSRLFQNVIHLEMVGEDKRI